MEGLGSLDEGDRNQLEADVVPRAAVPPDDSRWSKRRVDAVQPSPNFQRPITRASDVFPPVRTRGHDPELPCPQTAARLCQAEIDTREFGPGHFSLQG